MNRHPIAVALVVGIALSSSQLVAQERRSVLPRDSSPSGDTFPKRDLALAPVDVDPNNPIGGVTDQTLATSIRVRVLRAATDRPDSALCISVNLQFTPLNGGSAIPSVAPTEWKQRDCTAEVRWHLSADTGLQFLQVVAVQQSSTPYIRSLPIRIRAQARGPARDLSLAPIDSDTPIVEPDHPLARPVRVRVMSIPDTGFDSTRCVGVTLQFTPSAGGSATPASAPTVWTVGHCDAEVAWHLSADTGWQYIEALAVQPGTVPVIRSDPIRIPALARSPSRDLKLEWGSLGRTGGGVEWGGRKRSGFAGRTQPLILVRIRSAGSTLPLTAAQCATLAVRFNPLAAGTGTGGSAQVSPAQAEWTGDSCVASVTWRLADEPGDQYLEAYVQQGSAEAPTIRSNRTLDTVVARQLPEVVFGMSLVGWAKDLKDTLTTSEWDYVYAGTKTDAQPMVGIEFPLSVFGERFCDRLRVLFGASTAHWMREFYFGFSAHPLVYYGPRLESFPVHVVAGFRLQRVTVLQCTNRCDRWNTRVFVGLVTTGSSLVKALLGSF